MKLWDNPFIILQRLKKKQPEDLVFLCSSSVSLVLWWTFCTRYWHFSLQKPRTPTKCQLYSRDFGWSSKEKEDSHDQRTENNICCISVYTVYFWGCFTRSNVICRQQGFCRNRFSIRWTLGIAQGKPVFWSPTVILLIIKYLWEKHKKDECGLICAPKYRMQW